MASRRNGLGNIEATQLLDAEDGGLPIDTWLAFPKLGDPGFLPHVFPRGSAELAISFPAFIATAARVSSFLKSDSAPPLPPADKAPRAKGNRGPGGATQLQENASQPKVTDKEKKPGRALWSRMCLRGKL